MELRKKHIVLITEGIYPEASGGSNKIAFFIAKALNDINYKISIITRAVTPEFSNSQINQNFKIFRYYPSFPWFFNSGKEVINILKERHDELGPIDCFFFHYPYAIKQVKKHFPNIPIIFQMHSPVYEEGVTNRGVYWSPFLKIIEDRYERPAVNLADQIVVHSLYLKNLLTSKYGALVSAKIKKFPGGLEEIFSNKYVRQGKSELRNKYKLPQDKKIIICTRRLVNRTGVMEFAKAISKYNKQTNHKLFFVITGGGYLLANIKKCLKQFNNVIVTGFIDESQLKEYISLSDIAYVPTKSLECFGLATLEALNYGIPVVVTNSSANPEVVNELGGGIVIPFGIAHFINSFEEISNNSFVFPSINHDLLSRNTYDNFAADLSRSINNLKNE